MAVIAFRKREKSVRKSRKSPPGLRTGRNGDGQVISDRILKNIADQIISGRLHPGYRLDEIKLAAAFKVSRTPVREALKQLVAARLVDWRPHQCAVVARIPPSELVEMFEVMAHLEGLCGSLRRTSDDVYRTGRTKIDATEIRGLR